jgi:ketosteroid isomerase-like protein
MTTQQVADRYYELSKENRFDVIVDELYSNDIECIEPASDNPVLQNIKGMEAKKAKDKAFGEAIEQMHSGYCDAPTVAGKYFSLKMGMDVTMKGMGRMNMDEICLFEVQDGKIVKEQYFY